MALISMRQMLDHAAEYGYGIPAFNVNNLEQVRAIMIAADKTNSPVILQAQHPQHAARVVRLRVEWHATGMQRCDKLGDARGRREPR